MHGRDDTIDLELAMEFEVLAYSMGVARLPTCMISCVGACVEYCHDEHGRIVGLGMGQIARGESSPTGCASEQAATSGRLSDGA